MKLSVGVLLLIFACASAIDVNMLRGKSAMMKTEPDAFDKLCNELKSFSSAWELEFQGMGYKLTNVKKTVNKLQIDFGTLDAATKKIADKKMQVDIAQTKINDAKRLEANAVQDLDFFRDEVASAKTAREKNEAMLTAQFDDASTRLDESKKEMEAQKKQETVLKTKLADAKETLQKCIGTQKDKDAKYQEFLKMSQTVTIQTQIVEKSMAVVETKTITKKSTTKVGSSFTYDLDTMQKIYKDVPDKVIEKKYKLVTQSVASVRTELTMKSNALIDYMMKTDKEFAQKVNADMQKKINEKQAKSIEITKDMMKTAIKDETALYKQANGKKLRFARAGLLSAARALHQHLLDNAAVMDAHLQHYAAHHQQAKICRSHRGKGCSGVAITSKGTFAVQLEKVTAKYTAMIDEMCARKSEIDAQAELYNKLMQKQDEDKELTQKLTDFGESYKKLQKSLSDVEELIQIEKTSLLSIQRAQQEYQDQWNLRYNDIVFHISETNAKTVALSNYIKSAGEKIIELAKEHKACSSSIAKIEADQKALFKQAQEMYSISTTSKNSLATTVKEESMKYDAIQGASEDLNSLISGFTKLGSKAKFFTKEDFSPGGKEYFSKRDAKK